MNIDVGVHWNDRMEAETEQVQADFLIELTWNTFQSCWLGRTKTYFISKPPRWLDLLVTDGCTEQFMDRILKEKSIVFHKQ